MEDHKIARVSVIWRDKQFNVEIDQSCNIKDFGQILQDLTNVKPDTLKLLVPQSEKRSSKLVTPFSDVNSSLSLQDAGIIQGKSIRMMGVFEDEIEEVSENNKRPDLRIIGFDEEERRLKQRSSNRIPTSLKLPQGPYIFCEFRTLHLPGIELNPPPSEALKRMHMLACDPGIIAVMNKHKWRVGIMTEMAPVGYVGISSECILGLNKNKGEEISLRLRTDDLKGFRKYDVIKKTLIHELAHMVHSAHDANFFALNKQLTEEADSLDWTRSKGHTLNSRKNLNPYDEEEFSYESTKRIISNKLGGEVNPSTNTRASAAAAAYKRFVNISIGENEPDPDENKPDPIRSVEQIPEDSDLPVTISEPEQPNYKNEPDPDENKPDPIRSVEQIPEDSDRLGTISEPNNLTLSKKADRGIDNSEEIIMVGSNDDDDMVIKEVIMEELNPGTITRLEPDPDESRDLRSEPDPDDVIDSLNSEEMQRIGEPVAEICSRLQKLIRMLRSEVVNPVEAAAVLQTLSKIIRNVIEHPKEIKFRRLRKANPQFQRNVANYTAAMEVLKMVGFTEDVIADEIGRVETYMVLKRNDPGLLWLAKSSLEVSMA